MNKKILLALVISVALVSANENKTFAATFADQLVQANLGTKQSVVAKGASVGGTITPDTGVLSSLAPSFTVSTNKKTDQTLYLTALTPYGTGTATTQGFTNYTGQEGTYLVLANTDSGSEADVSAITNIVAGTITTINNDNAIAFPFTPQGTKTGITAVTWDSGTPRWTYTLAQKGDTDFDNSTSGTPLTNTYTTGDEPGSYESTVTLSFAP